MDDACTRKSCHEHLALQWPTAGAVRENPSHSMPQVCHRTVAVVLIAGVSAHRFDAAEKQVYEEVCKWRDRGDPVSRAWTASAMWCPSPPPSPPPPPPLHTGRSHVCHRLILRWRVQQNII
jgi:hypothetical protein